AASELKPKKDQNDQVAIINFIVLDNNGKQLTSSGPLTGKPGESINDLYSTEIPLKAIAQTGYHVVFNGFDGDGQIQKFNNNDLMTQVFTVGLSKSAKSETKAKAPEKQSDVDLDAVREATINNKDTAAMALGIVATIISLIGLIGKENK
ncbi:mucin-binding protein, partial [Lactobacillus amylovorus]|uniref:mucin-binding protein n=1 Tax=Lactobacillus amylovorus TaxID=1604 RepID=UPI002330C65C